MSKDRTILDVILSAPVGIAAGGIERALGSISRTSINRKLKELVDQGRIVAQGEGAARVYVDADPFRSQRRYFEVPYQKRAFARFNETRLDFAKALDSAALLDETNQCATLDKRNMVQFLVDFACASSILEGGTYSMLDTQALIEYGEKAKDKPLADAFLVLNHKSAFEYLYDHPNLSSIIEVNRLLVDDHGLESLRDASHFLDKDHQGVREFNDVQIALSTYSPPFKPGTGYIKKMLERILATSESIDDPLESAFYLLTRIPYLQPFSDGNKRTSRAMCNVPLLKAGLPPISFIDFDKKDYITSMLSFYELGDTRMAAAVFSAAYRVSCERMMPLSRQMSY